MYKNLKQRIEDLMIRTKSEVVLEACKEAVTKINENQNLQVQESVRKTLEDSVVEKFISAIKNESAILEFADIAIKNLGIHSGLSKLWFDDLKEAKSENLSLKYVVEKLTSLMNNPEWLIYEEVLQNLKPFDFDPRVKEIIETVESNVSKFSEDIKIHKAIHEAKVSRANFILPSLQKEIDAYTQTKSPAARTVLIEKLNKYLFDPTIKKLHNIIVEASSSFEIKATSNDAIIKRVYSPVIVAANETEIFVVQENVYKKEGENLRILSKEEVSALPEGFVQLAAFINQPNVEVTQESMKIFSRDKKVEIKESSNGIKIKVNETEVSPKDFDKIYLNSGVFNNSEIDILRKVKSIIENWNNIFDIDFAKSIYSKGYPNRRADVFRCGDKIHITTVDSLMKENLFHEDCTAYQSRNKILEFVNYDLAITFKDMMNPEEQVLRSLEEQKAEFSESIHQMEKKKKLLESQEDYIKNSPQVQDLLEAISTEVAYLKNEYFNVQSKINSLTKVSEGVGVSVGDTVEYLKKTQS